MSTVILCYAMISTFKNSATEDIFNGVRTKQARKLLPLTLWKVAARKLDMIDSAHVVEDLRIPPGNRLEILSGDREGEFSIRINDQYRICFGWGRDGPINLEIVDYH